MIYIAINNIRVNAISTVGSLNIGKTILCHNRNETMAMPAAPVPPAAPAAMIAPAPPGAPIAPAAPADVIAAPPAPAPGVVQPGAP